VKAPRTILLVAAGQAILTAFSDEIQRFPANFIADRAAEDGGGEAFQHSSGGLKARSSPLSAHVRRRRIEKRPDIVKTIPGRRATLRSTGRGSRVTSAGS